MSGENNEGEEALLSDEPVNKLLVASDISVRADNYWRDNYYRLEKILNGVSDSVTVQDLSGNLLYANTAAARLLGFNSAAELLATPVTEVVQRFIMVTEDGQPFPVERLPGRLALAGKPAPPVIIRFQVVASGEERWTEVKATPSYDNSGQLQFVVNTMHEVTQLKQLEAQLREQRENFLVTLASIGDAVIACDNQGRVTFLNGVAEQLTGWSQAEANGQSSETIFRIINEHTRQPVENPIARVLKEGVVVGLANHTVLLRRDGRAIPIDDSGAPIRDVAGNVIGAVLVFRDVTDRKKIEVEQQYLAEVGTILASSLDYSATLQNLVRSAVPQLADFCVVDIVEEDGTFQRLATAAHDPAISAAIGELTKRYPPDPKATTSRRILQNQQAEIISNLNDDFYKASAQDDYHLELQRKIAAKEVLLVPLVARGQGLGVLWLGLAEGTRHYNQQDLDFAEEVARRAALAIDNARLFAREQQSRAAAEEAREQMAFLAEASITLSSSLDYQTSLDKLARLAVPTVADYCVIDIVEEDGTITRAALSHVDPAKEQLMREVQSRYPPDPNSDWGISRVIRTGEPTYFAEVTDSVLVTAARSPEHLALLRALASKSGISVPLTGRDRVLGVLTLAFAESGRIYNQNGLAFCRDLARRAAIAIENTRLYQTTQQALKKQRELDEIKDRFLSVASHELRTPLTSIKAYSQMLERSIGQQNGNERDRRLLSRVIHNSNRMNSLIREMLEVSRLETGQFELFYQEKVDLVALVRQAVEQQQTATPDYPISLETDETRIIGTFDEARLEQVLDNLIGNAVKYSPAGNPINVGIIREAADANMVQVWIEDKGSGISPEEQKLIFEQFYRVRSETAKVTDGLGLGLYISHQIVTRHGGRMWLKSTPGEGSTFYFTLPLTPPAGLGEE